MDKRAAYSQKIIKEAFLKLISEKTYASVTVTDVCREAEVNRSTFYLHFKNINNVLDAVLEDAFLHIEGIFEHFENDEKGEGNEECRYPLCRFIRESKEYQSIFMDQELSDYIIGKIARHHREGYIQRIRKETNLSEQEINTIFWFQLHGCFSVARYHINRKDEDWSRLQCTIDTFIKKGFFGKLPTQQE